MKSSPYSNILIMAGVLAMGFVSWFCADLLDGFQEQSHQMRLKEELWDAVSYLHHRGTPDNLARERLIHCLQGISAISPENVKFLVGRIQENFGQQARYMITEGNGKICEIHGFGPAMVGSISTFLAFRAAKEEGREVRREIMEGIMDSLQMGISPGDLENRMEVANITIGQEMGWLLSGVIAQDEHLPSMEFQGKFQNLRKEYQPQGNRCTGRIFLFIPETLVQSPGWFTRLVSHSPPDFNWPFWAGNRKELSTITALPAESLNDLEKKLASDSEDVFESHGWKIGFVKTAIPDDWLQICYLPNPPPDRPARTMLMILMGVLALVTMLTGIFLNDDGNRTWPSPLTRKFLALCLIPCLVPLFGLSWMAYSRWNWHRDLQIAALYKDMEGQISDLEAQELLIENDIISKTKLLLDPNIWFQPPGKRHPFFNQAEKSLLDARFSVMYIFHRHLGKFIAQYVEGRKGPAIHIVKNDSELVPIEVFLQSILSLLTDIMKFPLAQGQNAEADRLKIGILLDSLRASPEIFASLNQMGLDQDVLFLARLFQQEATWTFLHIAHAIRQGPTRRFREPIATFFLVFSRKWHQRQIFVDTTLKDSQQNPNQPSLVLLWNPLYVTSPIVPEHFSRHPIIQQIMYRLSHEGGLQRMPLTLGGREFLTLARPLKNLDMVAMALRPTPSAEKPFMENFTGGTLGIAYLFVVISILVWLFRWSYLTPIIRIQSEVNKIAGGDFDIRLPVTSEDELGTLSRSFNRMAEGLKEKEYLTRFLSDLTLEKVKSSDRLPATRLKATILFSDIRGFTTLSESLQPEIIVDMLNQHLTRMEGVIQRHGGSIDKFIGDAIMAVFLPLHGQASSAERATRAGLEMMTTLRQFNLERAATGLFQIKIGVGIATGQVLMGVLGGSGGRQDYTVTGGTVNQAAQMEKRTKEAQKTFVVICGNTREAIRERFDLLPLASDIGQEPAFEVLAPVRKVS